MAQLSPLRRGLKKGVEGWLAEDAAAELRRVRQNQEREAEIKRIYAPKNNPDWVLKYNPHTSHYQYVPPTAELKYNALENRYEWVP